MHTTRTERHRIARAVTVAAAAIALLAGCTAAPGGGDDPQEGGSLRIAAAGRGAAETFDPNLPASPVEFIRNGLAYEPLVNIAPSGDIVNLLATELTPNEDATVWHAKLREGVTFHDGSEFDAADVLYTFQLQADPEGPYGRPEAAEIDFDATTVIDDHTIDIALHAANATWNRSIVGARIVPEGAEDFSTPNGTGPFRFESGTIGTEATYTRNEDYWGEVLLDEVTVINVDDAQARVSALTSGEVDVIEDVPFVQADILAETDGIELVQILGNAAAPFYMRVDQAPFDDNRVREAFKLAIDREKCVDSALFGFGKVANDLVGPGGYSYNRDLPQRTYDPERAKELLAEAGYPDGITVELVTSDMFPGMLECSIVFADSAKAAGITIELNQVPANDLFNVDAGYMSHSFGTTWWPGTFEPWFADALMPGSPYNESHETNAAYSEAYRAAAAIVDEAERIAAMKQLQADYWENGGYIIWGEQPLIHAISSRVHGYEGFNMEILGPVDLRGVWVE